MNGLKWIVGVLCAIAPLVRDTSQAALQEGKIDEKLDWGGDKSLLEELQGDLQVVADDSLQGRIFYNNSQVWKTCFREKSLEVLSRLKDDKDIAMWGGNLTCVDFMVRSQSLDKVKKIFTESDMSYEVIINDLQRAIDEENPSDLEELDNRKGYRLTWQAYHRLNDIHEYLDYLAGTYPQICTVQTIGNSVQGRPIKLLKISNGKSGNKAVWMDGGIHAREWISPATVTYIISQIVENYDNDPLLKNVDWYVAPLLNPDGYEYSHTVDRLWRKNRARGGFCQGVDLNRNFGFHWGERGSSPQPCMETYRGTGPFSEPETASIQRFITQHKGANWKAYLSFHSYGQYILYPWGFNQALPQDYLDLDRLGRLAVSAIQQAGGPAYTLGSSGRTLYPAAGGSDDWAKGVMGIKYAYTIELRDNGRFGFVLPASYINPTAKEAYAAIRAIVSGI